MKCNALLVLLLFVVITPTILYAQCPTSDPGYIILDFENDADGNPLQPGQIIDQYTYAAFGIEFYSITSAGQPASSNNPLVIFDSANPTGDDCDLGTPSFHCPSNGSDSSNNCSGSYPGQSNQAGSGGGQNNCTPEYNILIIEENYTDTNNDNLDDDPDDLGGGGIIRMVFSNPYNLQKIKFVDDAEGSVLVTFSNNTTQSVPFNVGLDNDVYTVVFNLLDVVQVDIDLIGSGGFASIELCDLVTGTIGDQLFIDSDCNNLYDPNIDLPIAGVTVSLTKPDNSIITTTTDVNGKYLFVDVPVGNNIVTVDSNDPDFPSGVTPGTDLDGIATPNTATIMVTDGTPILNVDFGYKGTGSISNQLYHDINGNNTYQEGTDLGIANVDVKLTFGNGYEVTTTTDSNGQYIFNGLPTGVYTVAVSTIDPQFPTTSLAIYDFDGTTTVNTANVSLGAGENNVDLDFGYRGSGSISNQLYFDINRNNTYNVTDPPIPSTDVKLTFSNGFELTETTDSNGQYIFNNLPQGDYLVTVITNDPDYPTFSLPVYDYDGIATADVANVSLGAGEHNVDLDFGYRGNGSISNQLFIDINNNNIYDNGNDLIITDVDVELTFCNGTTKIVSSNNSGEYIFDELPPCNNYTVTVVTSDPDFPLGMSPTYDKDGIGTPNTSNENLLDSEHKIDVDFGYQGTSSISNLLFVDLNNNDIYDPLDDSPISFVEVELIDENGMVIYTTTDANGEYMFDFLPAGLYTVSVMITDTDFPEGVEPKTDFDGIQTANTSSIPLAIGEDNENVDFVYREMVLPVIWDDFVIENNKKDAYLLWSTYSESNASHYLIERSTDGQIFKSIGRVTANGTTHNHSKYQFTDGPLANGTYYYRLKQVDYDGRNDFSEIRRISIDQNNSIHIYPNPVESRLYISSAKDDDEQIRIMEATTGKTVLFQKLDKDYIDVIQLKSGVYILQVTSGHSTTTATFIRI